MSNLQHIASRVLNTPLLLEPAYASTFLSALAPRLNIKEMWGAAGAIDIGNSIKLSANALTNRNTKAARSYQVVDGVAVLPVAGTLVHKYGYLQPFSGMSGYDGILARHAEACADPEVLGILLDMDTPGGEVSGCFDAARLIRSQSRAANKPTWALSYDMACSGGMALAAAADRRLITQTAVTGSVGVITAHTSWEGALAESGIVVTLIHSGALKADGNPYKNLSAEVYARIQTEIDTLRQDFAQLVSSMLGIKIEDVLATEAAVYRGQAALDIKFADEVVNGNDAVALFADHLKRRSITTTVGGIKKMSEATPQQTETTVLAEQASKLRLEGASAERARIQTILQSPAAENKMALAMQLAFGTSLVSDEAIGILGKAAAEAPSATSNPLDVAMSQIAQPNIGTTTGQKPDTESSVILANFSRATGVRTGK
jgi:capsid assembly protease